MLFLFEQNKRCCYSRLHPQSIPSSPVGPRRSGPEQRELRGRLAGSAEDDPVSGLFPGLGLHFSAACHTDHSRVSPPAPLPPSLHPSIHLFLSISPWLRLALFTCQVWVWVAGRLAGRRLGCVLIHVFMLNSLHQADFFPSLLPLYKINTLYK